MIDLKHPRTLASCLQTASFILLAWERGGSLTVARKLFDIVANLSRSSQAEPMDFSSILKGAPIHDSALRFLFSATVSSSKKAPSYSLE